jgi:hypothetical protein
MNGPPHLLGEVSNTIKTAQLKELRRFLFKRKFIWDKARQEVIVVSID